MVYILDGQTYFVLITWKPEHAVGANDESTRCERAISDCPSRTHHHGRFYKLFYEKRILQNLYYTNESSKSKSEFRPSTLMFGLSGLGVNQTSLKIQDGSSKFEDRAGRSSTHYHSVELSHLIIRKIHKNSQKFMNNHVTQVRIRTCQWLS